MKIRNNTAKILLSMFILFCISSAAGCGCGINEPIVTPIPTEPDDLPSAKPTAGPTDPGTETGKPSSLELNVTILKIGKADAIILRSGDKAMIIDTGETDDGPEVVEFLKNAGIASLECMIITHYDKDHVGGACAVLDEFNVKRILIPDYEGTNQEYKSFAEKLETYPVKAERLNTEVSFSFGDASVRVQPPASYDTPDPSKEYDNNFSLLTWVEHGENRLFFTGDIEKARIKEWLASETDTKCDFLKFPHHGVYNKALPAFLEAVQPEYTVICSSGKNPAEDKTLRLLESLGIKTFETRNGDVTVISDGKNITVSQ